MCRIYKSRNGSYVRLCYRYSRCGQHIPVPDDYRLPSRHVKEIKRPKQLSSQTLSHCWHCGAPTSRHCKLCQNCEKESVE